MPELPEVETIKCGIAPHLEGKTITKVIVREKRLRWQIQDSFVNILPGQQIYQVQRRGKYLLFKCSNGYVLIHLGMSGNLRVLPRVTPLKKHDHLDIIFNQNLCLRYHDPRRFGCVLWTTEPILKHPLLVKLGPEPLETTFTGEYLYHKAKNRRVAVKNYIMNSHNVVGIGNIYANEALFLAGIHPTLAAGKIDLKRYQLLTDTIKQVLTVAIAKGGTTLRDFTDSTGKPGYFKQSLQVYGRASKACFQCGQIILKLDTGQRATFYCPVCQS